MKNYIETLDELELRELMDTQLKIQVDSSWPHEAVYLEEHGLSDARTVLDIGTGNAYLLCRLAERHPTKRFVGIESSDVLAELARKEVAKRGLSNVEIVEASCPIDGFERGFDFAFSRLAIYSTPDREAVIAWARERLRDGGKLIVLDVDHGYIWSWPHSEAWQHLFDAMEVEMAPKGADRRIGHKLPHMLLSAGFKEVKLDVKAWYSSFDMPPEKFRLLLCSMALLIHKVMPERFTKEDMDRFVEFSEKVAEDGTTTAYCPFLIASGVAR